jgi:TolB protein
MSKTHLLSITAGVALLCTVHNADGLPPVAAARDARLAPDREKIAFAYGPTDIHGDFYGDLYLLNSDGTGKKQLTRTRYRSEYEPAWSPDGRRIAFATYRRFLEIDVMNADGSTIRRVTRTRGGFSPAWSPDGARIAFVGYTLSDQPSHHSIYLMSADGHGVRRLTHTRADEVDPVWSPDGASIAFASASADRPYALYVSTLDGGGLRKLTNGPGDSSPAWAPDGQQIAFGRGSAIYLMNSDGRNQRRWADGSQPTWSSDGQRIALSATTTFTS